MILRSPHKIHHHPLHRVANLFKKEYLHLNLGCKMFLLLFLLAVNEIARGLPSTDLTYFQAMIRLDYLYAGLAVIDKDLRGQLIGLSGASAISHYLQMQDYIQRTPATEFINLYYLNIQPFLYHSMLGVFITWGIYQGFLYARRIRQRETNVST